MIKIIGIACLLAGFVGLSIEKIKSDLKKIEYLREVRNFAEYLHGEIEYSHIPIPDICREYVKRCRGKMKVFMEELCDRFEENSGVSFDVLWEEILEKQLWKKEEKQYLKELGNCFGFAEIGLQLSKIERYLRDMDKSILQYEKKFQDNKKLILYFGVMSGLLLSIILL